jgi:hypothetical protein
MSFRSSFSIHKTKPRKFVSRSPLKLPAEELARELGPQYHTIDACIGNQKMRYDIAQGNWISGNFQSIYLTCIFVIFIQMEQLVQGLTHEM